MLSLETKFNRQDFASSIAGISSETLDLFNNKLDGQFDRLGRMASMVSGDTKSLLDSGNWENGGSIDLTNSFSEFGFLETSSNNLAFDKSRSDISAKVQRDELTGMDFAAQNADGNIELVASQRSAIVPSTDVNLDLKSYTIQHQGLNTLNIKVDYGLRPGTAPAQYPNIIPLAQSINNFLINYPNETDFWEIVNKNLTQRVLDENPAMSDVTIQLEVLPNNRNTTNPTSTVFRSRSGQLQESLNLSLPTYPIQHQGLNKLDVDVNLQYKQGITPAEYPNFVPIYQRIDNFLTNYPNETDFWEIVNKNLSRTILAENPAVAAVDIDLNVLPNTQLPYSLTSKVNRRQPSSTGQLAEKLNFGVASYPIEHQGLNNLKLDVNYKYRDGTQQYPDFVPIYNSVDSFLTNYPNETDFWEIVNKNLTQKVLSDNPFMSSLTVKLDVLPSAQSPYSLSSITTRTPDGRLGESVNLNLTNYAIEHQGINNINVGVKYQYRQGIAANQYPDVNQVYNSIDRFLKNYPNETDFWEIVNNNLTQRVFADNPFFDSLQIELEVLPTKNFPYDLSSVVSIP
jgi:hypothetical protein